MSSFVRRLEIKILKAKGCVRETWRISPVTNEPERISKGRGRIVAPSGDSSTPHWPRP